MYLSHSKLLRAFFFVLLLVVNQAIAQEKFTISGNIKDQKSGEALLGASARVEELPGTGSTANEYGYYSITLPKGNYTIVYSFLGFGAVTRKIDLSSNQKVNIELAEEGSTLQEVEITSQRQDANVQSMEMSTTKIQAAELKKIPALMGEVDLVRAIQMMPGVQTVGEGAAGFYVRGGGVDQNLVLLDEAPVYNASHLMGFFSVFNADAIKDVQLYKGGIPAAHGGRLSSLLDIRMKDGNSKNLAVNGGIGVLSSRLTVEAPIVKDKSSFIISGRRTYADLFLKLSSDEALRDNKLYFYDFNAKFNYTLNENNRLFVSGYFGRDVMKASSFGFDWGNATATVRWNHIFNPRLFSNTTFIFSDFNYALGSTNARDEFKWTSSIRDYGIKNDYTYFANPENQVKFGFAGTYHDFRPGHVKPGPDSYFNEIKLNSTGGLEGAIYLSNEQKISPRISAEYGLRYSAFSNVGEGNVYEYKNPDKPVWADTTGKRSYGNLESIKTYGGLEPRLAVKYQLNDASSVKTSYNRTRQYLHLISNTTASLPFDVWTPSSRYIKPQISDQIAAGYFRNFQDNMFETSVEVYYKWMQNQIDYKDFANTFLNDHIETELLVGKGKSYGIETFVRKQKGKFTGWVSYTLSKTDRTVPGINNGKAYPVRYDRRHNVSVVTMYDLSERWQVGANWVYTTGGAVTMPVGKYEINGDIYPLYSSRNGYRLPDYHRLDLSATYTKKPKEGQKYFSSWNFSVYNAYMRKNAFSIYFRQEMKDDVPTGKTEAVKTYVFGIIPSVTYNFNF